jgi:hypothetical protein
MSQQYLDKYSSKISKRQTDQILQLLTEKRQAGEIRTVDEFIQRLNSLVQDLASTEISPSLKIFEAIDDETIDSETFNYMLARVEDDLVAAFEEANNIDEIQQSHRAVMRDMVFKTIGRGINRLESKLSAASTRDGSGIEILKVTFNDVSEKTTRNASDFGSLFSDPRAGKIINQDAFIEEVGDRLSLAKSTDEDYSIKKIKQIFDTSFPQSELIVEPSGTNLSNVIDKTEGTYWAQSLLFKKIQPYAKIKLELTLPTYKDFNHIEIEPITDKGLILETVEYEDKDLSMTTIWNEELVVDAPVRIHFQRVGANKLYLTLRNNNGIPVDFKYDPKTTSRDINSLSEVLSDIVPSVQIKNIIGILPSDDFIFSGYAYIFGLDNIRVGLSIYENQSIYVSEPFGITKKIGNLSLSTSGTRPFGSSPTAIPSNTSTIYDGNDSDFYFSSIEYWVAKRDYDAKGNTIRTLHFPIIPQTTTRINHERLVLSDKSNSSIIRNDVGYTTLFTSRTLGNVKVYENGSLLTYNVDWLDDTSATDKTPNSGSPMRFKIRILNPLVGDIYTVSYTPMKSTTRGVLSTFSAYTGTGPEIVDMVGDLSVRYVADNNILLEQTDADVKSSDIFVVVILKNNSSRNALSATVEEFALSIGLIDPAISERYSG